MPEQEVRRLQAEACAAAKRQANRERKEDRQTFRIGVRGLFNPDAVRRMA